MAKHKQSIGIKDSLNIIKKSANPVAPFLEALVNALDSIKKRQDRGDSFTPLVKVVLGYVTVNDLLGETGKQLSFIAVEDNGEGFTSENIDRFKKLADRSKRLNNRGTGKIQFFHRFKKVTIDSLYCDENKNVKVTLTYTIDDDIADNKIELPESEPIDVRTSVKLEQFSGNENEQEFFCQYLDDIKSLENEIFKRLILRLFLDKQTGLKLVIQTYLDGVQRTDTVVSGDDIPTPDKTETVSIDTVQLVSPHAPDGDSEIEWKVVNNDAQLTINRFKIPEDRVDKNGVFLCSKTILIEPFQAPLLSRILKKSTVLKGYRYISSVSGDILDEEENVKHSFDGFNFPKQKDVEKSIKNDGGMFIPNEQYIFIDEINSKVGTKLSQIYSDILGLNDEKEAEILKIAKTYGIPSETAKEITPNINDSNEKITKKLFERQAQKMAKLSIEIQQTYNEIAELEAKEFDPTEDGYEIKISEASNKLLTLIPQQNQEELARYVIRRDMVVKALRLAIKNELVKQQTWAKRKAAGEEIKEEQESIIHDFLFKRRTRGVLNDLWILNEEFVHFYGCSDLRLDELEVDGCKFLKDHVDI